MLGLGLMSARDRRCAALAEGQYGVISLDQALGVGLTRPMIDHRLVAGRWGQVLPGVYRLAGTSSSWEQILMAACLHAGEGSAASHRAAAALWRLQGVDVRVVEIVTPRRLRHPGVLAHRTRVPRRRLTRVGAIPVTDPARTLLDLGAVVPPPVVGDALDDALRRRLVDVRALRRLVEADGARGRNGTGVLRAHLVDRNPRHAPAESVLETRLAALLRASTLPPPVQRHEVRVGGRVVARVDFAWPDAKVAVEADGYRFHSGKRAWSKDAARRNVLTAAGWRVLHVNWDGLRDRPETVLADIRRALRFAEPELASPEG